MSKGTPVIGGGGGGGGGGELSPNLNLLQGPTRHSLGRTAHAHDYFHRVLSVRSLPGIQFISRLEPAAF